MSFTTFTPGVKYIKISKFDSTGIDNTLSLQEITDLRLNTNDNGFINYPIVGRTEYADYFLLQTVTTNITSSTNNQILDYQLVVTQSSPPPYGTGADSGLLLIGNYDSPVIDQQNDFNNTSGLYTFDNTPNIPIIFTASYRIFSTPGVVNPTLAAVLNGGSSVSSISNVISSLTLTSFNSPPQTITISGSFTPVENQTFGIYFGDLVTGPIGNIVGQFVHLSFTQSINPQAGIGSQTIIEPYLSTPFINSDYDSLINNAVVSRPNSNFFDVDFSSNQFTAVNEASIISASKGTGFATLSTVPESNYTTARIISPRYIGKELTSAEFNKWNSGDIAYGKTSNVGNPAVNFVYFEYLSGTTPEWGNFNEGKIFVNIKYIIDENGNAISPINDEEGINLGTIQQTFNGIDGAIVILEDNDAFGVNFENLNGLQSVFKSGYKIEPIIYTQSGSSFVNEIRFVQGEQDGNPAANDYRLLTQATNNNNFTGFTSNVIVTFKDPTILGESGSFTSNIYFPTGSPASLVTEGYILFGEAYLEAIPGNYISPFNNAPTIITYQIQKSIDAGVNWEVLREKNIEYRSGTSNDFSFFGNDGKLVFSDSNVTTSSLYRVVVKNTRITNTSPLTLSTNSYFKITQFPNPNTGQCNNFWETGSSPNILLAIEGITGLNNYIGQQQVDISGSGFFPISNTFDLQPFDEIRFEGLEILSFVILEVNTIIDVITSRERLQLILDRPIPINTNLDNFLVRRYVEDPSIIILNTSKASGGTSTGILKPEYISPELDSRITSIINDLKSKNII